MNKPNRAISFLRDIALMGLLSSPELSKPVAMPTSGRYYQ
jgi:hypothetical protein